MKEQRELRLKNEGVKKLLEDNKLKTNEKSKTILKINTKTTEKKILQTVSELKVACNKFTHKNPYST